MRESLLELNIFQNEREPPVVLGWPKSSFGLNKLFGQLNNIKLGKEELSLTQL